MRFMALLYLFLLAAAPDARPPATQSVTIRGTVTDARGAPVAGAAVIASTYETTEGAPDAAPRRRVWRTTSGRDGAFRVAVTVPVERWFVTVAATKAGHGPGGQNVDATQGPGDVTITLTRPSAFAGRVVDRAGQPIKGATVTVQFASMPTGDSVILPPPGVRPPVVTDAAGRFRVEALPAHSRLSLSVEHPRYARVGSFRQPMRAGTEDTVVALPRAGAIGGRVLDEQGRPAPNRTVTCQGQMESLGPVRTDGDGAFRFGNLAGGQYTLAVRLPEGEDRLTAEHQVVLLEEGAEVRCPDLRLAPPAHVGEIRGKVTDEEGQPVAGARITTARQIRLPQLITYRAGPTAQTAADGSYRLRLPAGKWRLSPSSTPPGYLANLDWDAFPEPEVGDGQTVSVDFRVQRTLTLRGRVLDAAGNPVPRAGVGLTGRLGLGRRQLTDADGRFQLASVAASQPATLRVLSRDRLQGAEVEVTPAQMKEEVTLRVQTLPRLAGVLKDERGAPVADAFVSAERMVPVGRGLMTDRVSATTTDARGRFELGLFPDAQYRVVLDATGFAPTDRFPVTVAADPAAPPVEWQLERANGTLAGVVVDPENRPVPGVTITVSRTSQSRFYTLNQESTTDAQGRFEVRGLPAGEVQLNAQRSGWLPEWLRGVKVGAQNLRVMMAPVETPRRLAPPATGSAAPEIHAAQWVNGSGPRRLAELRGQRVVLLFGSAYNPAARAAHEALKALHAALKASGRTDVVILALFEASTPAAEVAAYARAEGLPFPIGLVERTRGLGVDSPTFTAYGVRRLPTLFLIDGEGKLQAVDAAPAELAALVGAKPVDRLPVGPVGESVAPTFQSAEVANPPGIDATAQAAEALHRRLESRRHEFASGTCEDADGDAGRTTCAPDADRSRTHALRYTLDPGGPPIYSAGQRLKRLDAAPSGVKLPRFHSPQPRFLTAEVGEGAQRTFLFAVDESAPGSGYDLLYADGNQNQDLTDEPPLRLTRWGRGRGFQPVRLLIEMGGSRVQSHVAVTSYDTTQGVAFSLQGWGYFSGEATFGEKSYPVALMDYNGNGRFDDRFLGFETGRSGDMLLVDVNGDGEFEQSTLFGSEAHYAAGRMQIDGAYYELAFAADGTTLTVTPSSARLATVRSAYEKFALMLGAKQGVLMVRSSTGAVAIPVGEYALLGWQIEQRDRDGSLWQAQATLGRGEEAPPTLTVQPDTPLPALASPLLAKLTATPTGDRTTQFSLSCASLSGAVIQSISRNGGQPPEPRLRIRDPQGQEVANVPLHYG